MPHFHHFSICNQNQSISNLVIFGQNTKAIALLLAKNAIFITFQSAIKINQFQFGHFWAKYQGYSLTFGQKCLIFITFQSAIKIINFNLVIFGQNTKAIALLFWPKMPHFHHFSICNQNQSISNLVSFGQNTKAIALVFGQKCLIFIDFDCRLKSDENEAFLAICNQNQSISNLVILGKIPRL